MKHIKQILVVSIVLIFGLVYGEYVYDKLAADYPSLYEWLKR